MFAESEEREEGRKLNNYFTNYILGV
jgi:hypothetical protein